MGRVFFALGLLALISTEASGASVWLRAPSMQFARYGHAATLMQDGRVLFVGGRDTVAVTVDRAELFDTRNGAWNSLPAPFSIGPDLAAVALLTGEVFVIGGATNATGRTVTFDPRNDSWTERSPIPSGRYGHTATLLRDGRVLVAGGRNAAGSLASNSYLYDRANNTWTLIGVAGEPREGHTATLLQNGKVLVAGGGVASATLYDPVAGTWTQQDAMPAAQSFHTATLLPDGRALVVGGNTAYLFNPAVAVGAGQWISAGSLTTSRSRHVAGLMPDGSVVVTSGTTADASSTEVYSGGTWSAGPSLPFGITNYATATLLPSGELFFAGGFSSRVPGPGYGASASTAALHVDTGVWAWTGSLQLGRHQGCDQLLADGRVLAVGGWGGGPTLVAEIYDPGAGTWSQIAGLPSEARLVCTATLLPTGEVLVSGGGVFDSGFLSTYTYSPTANVWTAAGQLNETRGLHTSSLLPDGSVVVVGGQAGAGSPPRASAEIWDPAARNWTVAASVSEGRYGHSATLLPSGQLIVTGGGRERSGYNYEFSSSAEALQFDYNPVTNTRTLLYAGTLGQLTIARKQHQAQLLGSGELLLVGGGTSTNQTAPDTEIFHLASGQGAPVDLAGIPRYGSLLTLPGGRSLFAGGQDNSGFLQAADMFSAAARSWVVVAPPLQPTTSGNDFKARLLNNELLFAGGWMERSTSQLFRPYATIAAGRFPSIATVPAQISYGTSWTLSGDFSSDSETSSGSGTSSAANLPLVYVEAIEGDVAAYLIPDPIANLTADPLPLTISDMPPVFDQGYHRVTVIVNGVPSTSQVVKVLCSVKILSVTGPSSPVSLGTSATFSVTHQGGRKYQWQRCTSGTCAQPSEWIDIPGATGTSYTTPPVAGADAGTKFRVVVNGNCASEASSPMSLAVSDATPPTASLVYPTGGEYLLLSPEATAGNPNPAPNRTVVAWSMADDVRVCRVQVSLLYSDDNFATYAEAPAGGGLPASFGTVGACSYPGEGTKSLTYTIPTSFPSGHSGSLYKIRIIVTDGAGNQKTADSPNPFFIVRPNRDSVKSIILWNRARMISRQGITTAEADAVGRKLQELANHPRVLGVVADLSDVTALTSLYTTWDNDQPNSTKANNVLFGPGGLHEYLRTNLLNAYTGARYLVVVGDDRVIPLARLQDRTFLLPESTYANETDLSPTLTTVGQALESNAYLSDDPLGVLDTVSAAQLNGGLYVPDLAVGRLVETPSQIINTIATYIGQDGILDLTLANASTGHKVLVTGYDFLTNGAVHMRNRWKGALGVSTPANSTAPVDASLIGGTWGLGSVEARALALRTALAGRGGSRYGVMALAGHATHYEEGVPGEEAFDIRGLSTPDIFGPDACGTATLGTLDLSGGIVYSLGCHGGLPVPGSCRTDASRSLDLAETFLSRGVVAYIANTGYGWGLKHGIGYGSRLSQIFTEQLTAGGTVTIGDALKNTKQRYFLETPRYDVYDEKTLMQWTLFGLPMYAISTGIAQGSASAPVQALSTTGTTTEMLGPVRVNRSVRETREIASFDASAQALPSYLTQLNLSFDLTADGVYIKHDSAGNVLPAGPGCPDLNGCYYTLNGLVDRGTGSGDLPIEPYLIYDSRLAGTSQHGVLWKGGTYTEESGWTPVIAELISNGGIGSNHGATPRVLKIRPYAPRLLPGVDSPSCRPSDLELNSLTIAAGESIKPPSSLTYSVARRYRNIDLEVFYFNNTGTPAQNCDREGPQLGTPPYSGSYHQATSGPSTSTITWTVPVTDSAGVWRVLVVYSTNTTTLVNGAAQGVWTPVELVNGGNGTFSGTITLPRAAQLTYTIQAVDNRGNVSWLEFTTASLPSSGVALGVASAVDITFGVPTDVVASAASATSVAVSWSPVTEATSYDIYRKAAGTEFEMIGSSTSTGYTDNSVAASKAYLYAVKANNVSDLSAPDLATTVIFTDPVITPESTPVKAAHVTELRSAVELVRTLAGLPSSSYTDPTVSPGSTAVRAVHITQMRSAITAARSTLGLPPVPYNDPTVTTGLKLKAVHILDLRDAVR